MGLRLPSEPALEPSPLTCFVLLHSPARISESSSSSPQPSRTQSDQSEGETSFRMAIKERKYLGINVTRNVQHICEENVKHSKWTQHVRKKKRCSVVGKESASLRCQFFLI